MLSSISPFSTHVIRFICEIADNGQSYQWRSEDGALMAGRNQGGAGYWARSHGALINGRYQSLREAMVAAIIRRNAA